MPRCEVGFVQSKMPGIETRRPVFDFKVLVRHDRTLVDATRFEFIDGYAYRDAGVARTTVWPVYMGAASSESVCGKPGVGLDIQVQTWIGKHRDGVTRRKVAAFMGRGGEESETGRRRRFSHDARSGCCHADGEAG